MSSIKEKESTKKIETSRGDHAKQPTMQEYQWKGEKRRKTQKRGGMTNTTKGTRS